MVPFVAAACEIRGFGLESPLNREKYWDLRLVSEPNQYPPSPFSLTRRVSAGRLHKPFSGRAVFLSKNQSCICLESLSEEFKKDITDESSDHGNSKISGGKNISDGPS